MVWKLFIKSGGRKPNGTRSQSSTEKEAEVFARRAKNEKRCCVEELKKIYAVMIGPARATLPPEKYTHDRRRQNSPE
jgi:hypothetical protein